MKKRLITILFTVAHAIVFGIIWIVCSPYLLFAWCREAIRSGKEYIEEEMKRCEERYERKIFF